MEDYQFPWMIIIGFGAFALFAAAACVVMMLYDHDLAAFWGLMAFMFGFVSVGMFVVVLLIAFGPAVWAKLWKMAGCD
jgi:predicted permease